MTNNTVLLRSVTVLLAAVSPLAGAQAQEVESGTGNIAEIVVTAAKRAERIQDVPISISAIGGEDLTRSRATKADDLVSQVPNLQLTSTVGDNTPIFALRGVSMSDFSLNQSSPVASYYDEVYKGNFALLGVALFDLERVEVLRGPQGTLYGKNTTGGAVNFISRAPELGDVNGYVNLGAGNYSRKEANGAINIPLAETLAARVAFTAAEADGWFKNKYANLPDLASVREYGVRGSLLWEPSDAARFVLRGAVTDQNPYNYGIYAQPEVTLRPGLDDFEIESNIDERRKARTYSLALTATVDLSDTLLLTSISSWDEGRLSFYEDTDGTAGQLLEIPFLDRAKQIAQDLRLTSNFGGPFNFILGAYYNREEVFNRTTFELGKDVDSDGVGGVTDADCAAGFPLGCLFRNNFDQTKESIAIYSDASYEIAPAVTLRGGLRYTHDEGSQEGFESNALGPNGVFVTNLIPLSTLEDENDDVSGKIGIDYKLESGHLLYANASRGYRGSSFNAQAFFDPSELSIAKPETVNAYEVGAKMDFSAGTILLSTAAFYYDYRNQQFINVDPTTAAQTLLNIPKSRILGAEADLFIRTSDRWSLRAGVGLLDTEIKQGTVSGVDVAGNELSNAPELSFTGGLDVVAMDNSHGKVSLRADISYSSSQFFEVINVPRLEQDAYTLVGANVEYQSPGGVWNVSFWGKNLTDELYFTSRIDLLAGFGYDYNHIGAPRTYGVTVGVKF